MKQYRELTVVKGIVRNYERDDKAIVFKSIDNTDYLQMLAEIEAGEAEIIAYVEPVPGYEELRRKAYGQWGDQLDMQYHDSVDDTTTWVDHVARVKAAHPKS